MDRTPHRRQRISQTERVENTQRKLIDAALQLLHEEGFKGATLQAIARKAQVSLGALQHHFKTRDALMERLVQEITEPFERPRQHLARPCTAPA